MSGKVVSFRKYRGLCDAASGTSYRKLGIVDSHGYAAALSDSRTIITTLKSGLTIPLFVPMQYIGGYDAPRTQSLAKTHDTRLLAVPFSTLRHEVSLAQHAAALRGVAVVVETPVELTKKAKTLFAEQFSVVSGTPWRVHEFKDPRTPEGRQNANISVYEAGFEAHDHAGKPMPDTGKTLTKSARELGLADNVTIIGSRDIHKNPELLAELWDLCAHKFDMLGTFHPVSMEETQNFFEKMLGNQRTHSLVRFEVDDKGKNKPVAHGFFMDDLSGASWLSDAYIDDVEMRAAQKHEKIVFFYGIVSRSTPEASMHYSASIMKSLSHIGKYAGGRFRLVFESTNLSGLYIPRLVNEYTQGDKDGMTMIEPIKCLTGIDYWYIKAD